MTEQCRENYQELLATLSEETSIEQLEALQAHVTMCGVCVEQHTLGTVLCKMLKRACAAQAPQELRARILQLIHDSDDV